MSDGDSPTQQAERLRLPGLSEAPDIMRAMTSMTSMPYTDARLVGEALEALLSDVVPDDLSGQLVAQARPAVRFAVKPASPGEVPIAVSRFGGEPDLPSDLSWPSWKGPDGADPERPLSFFAQVNLASVPGDLDLPLPSEGLLLFFADFGHDDEIHGMYQDEHDGYRVLHVPATGLSRRRTPSGAFQQPEALLHPILVTTIPISQRGPSPKTTGTHGSRRTSSWRSIWMPLRRPVGAPVAATSSAGTPGRSSTRSSRNACGRQRMCTAGTAASTTNAGSR
jgi:hypothetical protein